MNLPELNVYIVDDDAGTRDLLAGDVHRHFRECAVKTFASGEEFLASAKLSNYGIAILDEKMDPGMTGSTVFKKMKAIGSPLCVIFLSANGTVPIAVQQMKYGAIDWLDKWTVDEDSRVSAIRVAMDWASELALASRDRQDGQKRWGKLTLRERQVAALVAPGKSSREISKYLSNRHPEFPIGFRVVDNYRARVFMKLEVGNGAELLLFLQQNDLWDEAQVSLGQRPGKSKEKSEQPRFNPDGTA